MMKSKAKKSIPKVEVFASSGNVFIDLGFESAEAQVMTMRADLMIALEKQIKARGMTQIMAAKTLGVSQARISDLARGKADKFSLDMLVTFAAKLGHPARLVLDAPTYPLDDGPVSQAMIRHIRKSVDQTDYHPTRSLLPGL